MRRSFSIADPVRIPFVANYRYLKKKTIAGHDIAIIEIDYEMDNQIALRTRLSSLSPRAILVGSGSRVRRGLRGASESPFESESQSR